MTTTTNRRRRVIAAALSPLLIAPTVFAADVSWLTPGTGFWDDAANWPGTVLPTGADDVTIDLGASTAVIRQLPGDLAGPLTQYAVGSLHALSSIEHAGGSLLVKGNATFEEAFTWSGGVLHVDASVPSGTWTFRKGIHLTAPGLVGMNAGRVELQGTSIFEGGGGLLAGSRPVHVTSGATLDLRAGTFASFGELVNDGTIDRTAGTGTYQMFVQSGGNQGVVRNRTGVLEFVPAGFDPLSHSGTFSVDAGAELHFVGAQTFLDTISGSGNVRFSTFNDFNVEAAKFALDGTVILDTGAKALWNGNGTIRNLTLAGANFLPQGRIDIINRVRVDAFSTAGGATDSRARFLGGLDLRANFVVNSGAVELGGSTVVDGDVGLGISSAATVTVLPGASLRLANDATPTGAGAILGGGRLVNQGLVQRDTGTGEFVVGADLVNEGTLALKSGRMSVALKFEQSGVGKLAIELGSVSGPLAVSGSASFAGMLEIAFADGFLPTLGQTFDLVTYADHTGTFTLSPAGEAGRTGYTYVLHYEDHRLGLEVTGLAAPVPEPGTYAMFGAGLGLLLLVRGRRTR